MAKNFLCEKKPKLLCPNVNRSAKQKNSKQKPKTKKQKTTIKKDESNRF